ncbi:MAG: hypothetical protein MUE91_11510 [Ignavibacteriaceae bacterium]|jgi:hypothetical protein|nr:hypothetical protein [Ignavibacteriaceae bacterium]
MDISIEEWELMSFFEVEPKKLDKDVIWFYNFNEYKISNGDFELIFSIEPCSADVFILLKRNETISYQLHARYIQDIRLIKDKRGEMLEIIINSRDRILLKINPDIVILQQADNSP